jgi:hypothetical protein
MKVNGPSREAHLPEPQVRSFDRTHTKSQISNAFELALAMSSKAHADEIVDVISSQFHKVQQVRLSKSLNLKTRQKGAHLRPRQISDSPESTHF